MTHFEVFEQSNDLKLDEKKHTELSNEEKIFKIHLEKIESKLKQFKFDLNNDDNAIKEHCIELRRKVQLATELRIQHVNDSKLASKFKLKKINNTNKKNEILIDQIDKFESQKLKNLLTIKKEKFHNKLKQWEVLFAKFKLINSAEITNESIDQVKDFLSILEIETDTLLSLLFNGNILEMVKSKESDLCLLQLQSFDNVDLSNATIVDSDPLFEQMRIIYQLLGFAEKYKSEVVGMGFLENENYYVAYHIDMFNSEEDNSKNLHIFQFDQNGTQCGMEMIRNALQCKMKFHKNKILVEYTNYITYSQHILVWDENMQTLNHHENEDCDSYIVGMNDSFIFCNTFDEEITEQVIIVLNWSLKVIVRLGQRNSPNDPFFLTRYVISMHSLNGKTYIIEKKKNHNFLRIVSESNGALVKSMKLKLTQMLQIDMNKKIVVFDKNSLSYLSSEGEIIRKVDLQNCMNVWSLDSHNNLWMINEVKLLSFAKIR